MYICSCANQSVQSPFKFFHTFVSNLFSLKVHVAHLRSWLMYGKLKNAFQHSCIPQILSRQFFAWYFYFAIHTFDVKGCYLGEKHIGVGQIQKNYWETHVDALEVIKRPHCCLLCCGLKREALNQGCPDFESNQC